MMRIFLRPRTDTSPNLADDFGNLAWHDRQDTRQPWSKTSTPSTLLGCGGRTPENPVARFGVLDGRVWGPSFRQVCAMPRRALSDTSRQPSGSKRVHSHRRAPSPFRWRAALVYLPPLLPPVPDRVSGAVISMSQVRGRAIPFEVRKPGNKSQQRALAAPGEGDDARGGNLQGAGG